MEIYGSGSKRGEQRRIVINFVGTDTEVVDLIDDLELAATAEDVPGRSTDTLAEILRQVNYWAARPVNHPDPTGSINFRPAPDPAPVFPVPVCPDREAGKAHGPHRIDGTWREGCPGVDQATALSRAAALVRTHLGLNEYGEQVTAMNVNDVNGLIAAIAEALEGRS